MALADLCDVDGRSSYRVLADTALLIEGPGLDLACGDGYLLELVGSEDGWLGLDQNAAELAGARARFPGLVAFHRDAGDPG